MPIQEKPKIQVSNAIYKQCGTESDELPVLTATDITYIEADVTGDGIKEKLAKYTEKKWVCPKGYQEHERGLEIIMYGAPKDLSKGVVKNSKGDSFTINDVALIGSERFYVFAIPPQSFEKMPSPDEIRIVLIPEKTLDKVRAIQGSKESLELQKKAEALEALFKKDPGAVDKEKVQEVFKQIAESAEKIKKIVATTVVAKRAGDIKKAGALPIAKEEKAAFLGTIALLRNDRNFAVQLIHIALINLAQKETAATGSQD